MLCSCKKTLRSLYDISTYMPSTLKSFFLKLSLFSVFTFILLYGLQHLHSTYFQTHLYWVLWLFFVIITITIHWVLMRVVTKDPKKFVITYMGITGIKLFSYLIIILIYALLKRQGALGFTLCFLVLYFLYTVFEVVVLYKQLRS